MYIPRKLENIIKNKLKKGKVTVLYGARRTGKTTLIKKLFSEKEKSLYLSCESQDIQSKLQPDKLKLKEIIAGYENIILDEAQFLPNPGLILKILIDNFPEKNFIASGSSSFDLANKLNEPLTGRYLSHTLTPISLSEMHAHFSPLERAHEIEKAMIFGSYPEIFQLSSAEEKIEYLKRITEAYLYKDILAFNLVKNSRKLRELLVLVALQIGSEVSYSELSDKLEIDKKTVENYLDLLEKSFVIFRLYGFSRNLRKEIRNKVKIYFFDLGVRNMLLNNFNEMEKRADKGGIFENFAIAEIVKEDLNKPQNCNFYFWRTYDQKEIDLLAEKNGKITALEFKSGKKFTKKHFDSFCLEYKEFEHEFRLVNKENFIEEILKFA